MTAGLNTPVTTAAEGESKNFGDGSALVRADNLPWISFPLNGVFFKPLSIDWDRHMYATMLKIEGGVDTGEHYHFGEAHAYMLTGRVTYEYGVINPGDYITEGGDLSHIAKGDDDDQVMFVMFFNGIGGLMSDGTPDLESLIDCQWVYDTAVEHNCAAHLLPPPSDYKKGALFKYREKYPNFGRNIAVTA